MYDSFSDIGNAEEIKQRSEFLLNALKKSRQETLKQLDHQQREIQKIVFENQETRQMLKESNAMKKKIADEKEKYQILAKERIA